MAVDQENQEVERDSNPVVQAKVKFELYGEEMIEKRVASSGSCGRLYLPQNWVGRRVKIIRIE